MAIVFGIIFSGFQADLLVALLSNWRELGGGAMLIAILLQIFQIKQSLKDIRKDFTAGDAFIIAKMDQGFKDVRNEMAQEFKAVRVEINDLRKDMDQGFKDVRTEMHQGFKDVRMEMDQMGKDIRRDMDQMGKDIRKDMDQMGKDIRAEMAELGKDIRTEMNEQGKDIRTEMKEGFTKRDHEFEKTLITLKVSRNDDPKTEQQ